jgi:oligoribonuclease
MTRYVEIPYNPDNKVFIDCEFTAMNHEKDRILSVAVAVMAPNGDRTRGIQVVVLQPPNVRKGLDLWNRKTHGQSGLLEQSRESILDESKAERVLIEYISKYVPEDKSPMCGYALVLDRKFIGKYMPKLHAFFHYKDMDVSFMETVAKTWYPDVKPFQKKHDHSALLDVHEAMDMFWYYKGKLMR